MGKHLSSVYKIGVLIFIIAFIYNEFVIYVINSWSWNKLKCKNEETCLKILLVADPQLIGEQNEIYHFLTPISIWDSDRFLRKTYDLVVDHLSPDVIIFLGDLLDEGSIANSSQYYNYLKRFFSIFTTGFPIKHIWLPGDNDIGGESDQVTEDKINRFNHAFSQSPVINIKKIRFSKVNRMIQNSPKSFYFENSDNNDPKLSIVVSHMPLTLVPGLYVDKVIKVLKPKIIFAAHEHKARIVQTDNLQQYRKVFDINTINNKVFEYKLDTDKIIEILVPTCSYRMGTSNIGYGAAVIEDNEILQYTVLWSPKRFVNLIIYFLLIILTIFLLLVKYVCRFNKSRFFFIFKQRYSYKIIKNGV